MTPAASHTNHMGVTYFLHAGTTKTGKPRYFVAKTVGVGALAELPVGYEFTESINGVVSVRRIPQGPPAVPPEDLARAAAELARHVHLSRYRAAVATGELVIYEPISTSPEEFLAFATMLRPGLGRRVSDIALPARVSNSHYRPVLKFVPVEGGYAMHRMTYRGDGGWSRPLRHGALPELLSCYVSLVGTDKLFDIY